MKLLAIETSCDETAIAILECLPTGTKGSSSDEQASFTVLGNALLSQIEIHKEYCGVFPALAKREHAKNLVPILSSALEEAGLLCEGRQEFPEDVRARVSGLLEREPGLYELFYAFIEKTEKPDVDTLAVTYGPGLEPALWVGVNFAKALALVWDLPLVGVNHLEGHILAAIATEAERNLIVRSPAVPLLALGIAGGHTDLVLMHEWLSYKVIGGTLDDSVGEAFDKVARMLGLPYPGGPEISKLAERARTEGALHVCEFPRPMMKSGTNDFSFSGLKTAVLYHLKKLPSIEDDERKAVALEFENAVAEVLWAKTAKALEETDAKTLVVSGGVSANLYIRRMFQEKTKTTYPHVTLAIPPRALTTDNAVMIGIAGYYRTLRQEFADIEKLRADGNLSLAKRQPA